MGVIVDWTDFASSKDITKKSIIRILYRKIFCAQCLKLIYNVQTKLFFRFLRIFKSWVTSILNKNCDNRHKKVKKNVNIFDVLEYMLALAR